MSGGCSVLLAVHLFLPFQKPSVRANDGGTNFSVIFI